MSELAKALVGAQARMPVVSKNKTVDSGKFSYSYATLDHLIAKTLPVLNLNGLSLVQMPVVTELGRPALRTTITHVSGESLSADMPLFNVTDMQSLGSAITYARRYAWAAALGIASEDDDDGAAASGPRTTNTASDGTMPFGKHKGVPFADVPAEYLDWVLAESKDQGVKDAIITWRLSLGDLNADPEIEALPF